MNTHVDAPRGRVLAALAALAAFFAAAFFLAPARLAGGRSGDLQDQQHLTAAARRTFVEYWGAGRPELTPDLQSLVDAWMRYQIVKAVTAALLLAVLIVLAAALWKRFKRTGGVAVTSAGVAVTMLALCSLVLVLANIQHAAAPFAALMQMLVDGRSDAGLAGALEQVRQQLQDGPISPALDAMIDDYADYHSVMAVMAGVVAVLLLGLSVMAWRGFVKARSAGRRVRVATASFGALMVLAALAVALVAVANTTVAADPAPPFLAFFNGGW